MKTLKDVQTEYNELSQKRDAYLKEANLITEQLLRLEGQAQLLSEQPSEEPKKNNKK